jgi:hypothetical protein
MRKALLSMSLAAFAASASAQCFDLAYGTSLGAGPDIVFGIQPIGFPFPFCGATYSDVHVCDKGYVFLSNGGVPAPQTFGDYDVTAAELVGGPPRICALWADLRCDSFTTPPGEVFIKSSPTSCTITWKDAQCFGATSGFFDMQMELSINGSIKFLYGPGTTNNSLATQPTWQVGLVGVSPGMGAVLPASLDLSAGGASPDNTTYELFPLPNQFDMANNGLMMIPTNPGWTFLTLGAPSNCASTSSYGTGCVQKTDSVYEAFTAGFDLNNTTITWLRIPGGYTTLTGIPGTFVTPSATAINIAPGFLDGDQTVPLSAPMPVPGGTTNSLNITTKGQVEFASGPTTIDFTPTAQELLDWDRTAFHCWHDYNQTTPGSGLILFEEVGGFAYATWNGVYSYAAAVTSTFQFQLELATGNVTLVMQTMNGVTAPDPIVIGYSVGGVSQDPGATDLSALVGAIVVADSAAGLGLEAGNSPFLGNPAFTLVTKDVPPLIPLAFLAFGDTAINPGVDLTFIGMAGCSAYTNANLVTLTFPVTGTSGSVSFPIPNDPGLIGATLSSQSLAFSLDTLLGLVSSNGVSFTVGN